MVLRPAAVGRPYAALRSRLLAWYRKHGRDLPWRKTRDPYRILVSEFLLLQTRVETARARYGAFLRRFPTIRRLARARETSVLAAWDGLGYYRRARLLHRSAKEIVRRRRFPRTAEELRTLPGVGPYMAAAVASIAFGEPVPGEPVPAVDGNVGRVVARLFGIAARPEDARGRRALYDAARPLVARKGGDVNQALMDLANAVCLPRNPRCGACPLVRFCATRGDALPPPKRAAKVRRVRWVSILPVDPSGRVHLERRTSGIWNGLFVPPSVEVAPDENLRAAALRLARARGFGGRLGGGLKETALLTHRRVEISLFPVRTRKPARGPRKRALPAPFRRLLDRLDLPG